MLVLNRGAKAVCQTRILPILDGEARHGNDLGTVFLNMISVAKEYGDNYKRYLSKLQKSNCQNYKMYLSTIYQLKIVLSQLQNVFVKITKYLSTNLTKLICVFSKKFKDAQTIAQYRTNIAQKPHPRF